MEVELEDKASNALLYFESNLHHCLVLKEDHLLNKNYIVIPVKVNETEGRAFVDSGCTFNVTPANVV